jgi:hypothetical protein
MAKQVSTSREARKLVRDLDAALARAGEASGAPLEWSESEQAAITRMVASIERRELLQRLLDAESESAEPDTMAVLKLSAELRQIDRLVLDLLGRVNPEPGPAKSERHQRAVNHRWAMARAGQG